MTGSSPQSVALLAARSTIGQVVARRLAAAGTKLSLIGRDLEGVDTSSATLIRQCDLTDFDAVETALRDASAEMGTLTGVVNCAGSMLLKPAHTTSRAEYDAVIAANVTIVQRHGPPLGI